MFKIAIEVFNNSNLLGYSRLIRENTWKKIESIYIYKNKEISLQQQKNQILNYFSNQLGMLIMKTQILLYYLLRCSILEHDAEWAFFNSRLLLVNMLCSFRTNILIT